MNNFPGGFFLAEMTDAEYRIEVVSSIAVGKSVTDPGEVNNVRHACLGRHFSAASRLALAPNDRKSSLLKQRIDVFFAIVEGRLRDRIEVRVYGQNSSVHFYGYRARWFLFPFSHQSLTREICGLLFP